MLCCGSWQDLLVSLHFCGVPLEPGDQELHLGGISSPRAAVTPVLQELEVTCVCPGGVWLLQPSSHLVWGVQDCAQHWALSAVSGFRIPKRFPGM